MKTNPPCEANGCNRTATARINIPGANPDFTHRSWLCGTCAKAPHLVLRSPAQQSAHVKALKAKPRKPNPASASNGKTGGRPRTTTPSPDALREAARIIREHFTNLDPVTHATHLEPVAVMLDRMAKGVRPEKAITTPQTATHRSPEVIATLMRTGLFHEALAMKEASASIALDGETVTK